MQRSLGHVSEDKEQDCPPSVGCWSEELEVDLHDTLHLLAGNAYCSCPHHM